MAIPKKAKEFTVAGKKSLILSKGELPAGYLEEFELNSDSFSESAFNGRQSITVSITETGIVVGADCEARYAIAYEALDALNKHIEKVLKGS